MSETFLQKRQQTAERLGLSVENVPRHIAVIMDGNGRWATERGLPRFEGHRQGAKSVETIVQHGVDIGLEAMTLYSFSMQNWKRPKEEVDFLMHLYSRYLVEIRPKLMEQNVRLIHLGRRDPLGDVLLKDLDDTVRITSVNDGMVLGLALNYGSRTEMIDAIGALAEKCVKGEISPADIDEKAVSENLYTRNLPDPDLVVRTSGEMRISNFLLWQVSYAEFYVTQTFWPEFEEADLDEAVRVYAQRQRRFGDVESKINTH